MRQQGVWHIVPLLRLPELDQWLEPGWPQSINKNFILRGGPAAFVAHAATRMP
jgi:hypothetical protein